MGEDDVGKGRIAGWRAGQGDGGTNPPAPLPPPYHPPQSIDPSTLTRRRMCKVEMISEAEKS